MLKLFLRGPEIASRPRGAMKARVTRVEPGDDVANQAGSAEALDRFRRRAIKGVALVVFCRLWRWQGLNMSQDPDDWWHDEYFEQIGRKEDIAKALNDISEDGAREYLGTYGDAIAKRFELVICQAEYARQQGYPHFAILGAVTAIELVMKHMLFRPLLQGAFLSDAWAQILTQRVTKPRSNQERDILPQILEIHGLKIKELKLSDKSDFWTTLTGKVTQKRNRIAHQGEFATAAEAILALECAHVMWTDVALAIAKKLGFELDDDDDKWCDGVEDGYEPKDPFQ